jgi:ComF family protein
VRAVPAKARLLARTVLPTKAQHRSGPKAAWAVLAWFAAAMVRLVVRLVAPPRCAACDAPSPHDAAFCPTCAATVVPADRDAVAPLASPQPARAKRAVGLTQMDPALAIVDSAFPIVDPALAIVACGMYRGALASAVRRLKYGDRPDLARPLGAMLGATVATSGLRADLVVPVPLHPRKLRERGYNQSALLAGAVARAAGAPLAARGLVRTRDTAPQASLSKHRRRDNIAGAFRARSAKAIHGNRILLVDDVATTGATLRACAEALLTAGAASVTTVVLARAPEHG